MRESTTAEVASIQNAFFAQVKEKLPAHVTLVDEVADVLNVSNDSAYRRIRCEKELSMMELLKLAQRFGISVDRLSGQLPSDIVAFKYNGLNEDNFNFDDYLKSILQSMHYINSHTEKEMIYAAKDIPLFALFHVPEVAAFKIFMWQKTILNFKHFQDKIFSLDAIDPKLIKLGKQTLQLYNNIPSSELWSDESINSLLRQIEFYLESDMFENRQDAMMLLNKIEELVEHFRTQAKNGVKFMLGEEPKTANAAAYKLYYNEVVLSDNTVLTVLDGKRAVYLTHNALNFLVTNHETFCNTTYYWFQNLTQKSNLISGTSEKGRNKFFSRLQQKVKETKARVNFLLAEFN